MLNYAQDQIRIDGSLGKKFIKYVYPDANCTLMAFTSTGRFISFNSKSEFDSLILHVDNTCKVSEDIYKTIEVEWAYPTPGK